VAEGRCGAPLDDYGKPGESCKSRVLPGFDYCLPHLPEDQCDAAWELGWRRCKGRINNKESLRYGQRCGKRALDDADFCGFHMKGMTPLDDGRKGQMTLYRIHQASKAEGIDTTVVANPLQSLLEVAAEAMALKDELKRQVLELETNAWRYEGVAGEQIRGEIILYERALDRIARLLVTITRLGIEERLARVEERQARLIEAAVAGALADTGLPAVTQDLAREAVSRRLRAAG
jgi:hypothetical protein